MDVVSQAITGRKEGRKEVSFVAYVYIPTYLPTGVYCSLLTGQEKREVPFADHVAATVEMANTCEVGRCVGR